jgi:hypothetical protein
MKPILIIILTILSLQIQGQQKTAPKALPVTAYVASMGGNKSADISTDLFKKVIDSGLVVTDDKGNSFPVTRFRINYTFVASFTDGESQQKKDFKDFRAGDFYDTNMLSEDWRGSIKDNAKKGDQVIINNITIRLKNGKKLMIQEWKGTLK